MQHDDPTGSGLKVMEETQLKTQNVRKKYAHLLVQLLVFCSWFRYTADAAKVVVQFMLFFFSRMLEYTHAGVLLMPWLKWTEIQGF